jgi:hypothetical protein
MEGVREFFHGLFGAAGGVIMFACFFAIPIGELYWLWMAIQLGSFWMFALGLLGPLILVWSPIGLYSLIFGTPQWVLSTFG